ncbi:SH3 domain-containing protein [Streptomyces sp. NPDC087512]|uniref:SH3 domain-containing protein n=1 Tax=Streptomyces sp. NPDC087512 TaxID=3155059 RepID=UPI0034149F7B
MRAAHRAKLAALAVAVLAVPTGLVVTSAGPVSAAAACGKTGPLRDGTNARMPSGVSANMRSGSSTACGVKGWADNQDWLMYYCWTYGENGTWTYVWNLDDNTLGWVKDSLLPDNGSYGSNNYCGF